MLGKFVRFVLNVAAKYTGRIAALVFFLIYAGLFWSFAPYMLKLIIDTLVNYQGDAAQIWSEITPLVILYLSAWLSAMVCFRALDLIERSLYPNIRHDIMNIMFEHIVHHSHYFFQNNLSGSISNRIIDLQNGVVAILRKMDEVIFNIVMVIFGLGLLASTHMYIAGIFIIWIAVFVSISIFFFQYIISLSQEFSLTKTRLVGHFVDAISNMNVIRFFAQQDFECFKTNEMVYDTVLKERKMRRLIIIMRSIWDVSMFTAISSLFYTMVYLYSKKIISVGDFAFVITLAMNIFHCLWHLTSQYAEFSEELGKCYQALKVLETPHDIVDNEDAITLEDVKGEISFRKVTFHYNDGKQLFKNKSIHIQPQEKIGLVGFSGSGKSSFISLIARLFDIESGDILIDGHSIKNITQKSLRQNISIIPQDPGLFYRTVRENIAYGKPTASDEEIITASKFAHCHEFIEKLENNYDTMVGEKGVNLSGGQRQRIAIARAFLENSPILILDEATSALDSVTETYIQESLNNLMSNKTTIVIAHRLSTLAQMDRILVFDHGKLIEEGTHDSLIKKGKGHYAKMWSIQAQGAILGE